MMMNRRWIVIVACLVVVGLIVGVVAAFGLSSPQSVSSQAKQGPSAAQLEKLAADLSSGSSSKILASIADVPPGGEKDVLKSLGNIKFVDFNTETVRFDTKTGAAVVQARLTPKKGKPTYEREVLVLRNGTWLLYSSLPNPTPT